MDMDDLRKITAVAEELKGLTTYCDKLLMLGKIGCEGSVLTHMHYGPEGLVATIIYKDVTYDIAIAPRSPRKV